MSRKIIGIDLGTTNSLVGLVDGGFPVLVPDENGERLTPSAVYFAPDQEVVGRSAKRSQLAYPKETITSAKRLIGKRYQNLTDEDKELGYEMVQLTDGEIGIKIRDQILLPEDISSKVLKKLKLDAESYLGTSVKDAVVTVPAYFNDAQRNATKRAGEKAGLNVVRLLNEPTAAALAYGVDKKKKSGKYVVYDLGGGTFDLTVLEMHEGVFQVLSTHGDTHLGGDDIDKLLADRLIQKALEQGFEIKEKERLFLREKAEQIKCALSFDENFKLECPFFTEKGNFICEISRRELEDLSKPLIEKTIQLCWKALEDAKLQPQDIDEILLVGGSTRMKLVRSRVKELFGKEPDISINPDEAVAMGATIQAGILSGELQNVVLLDVIPLSLGIETFGGLMNVIIPRNTTIPAKAGELFTNAVDNQKEMQINVLQGERELAKDNWFLGEVILPFDPVPRAQAKVGVQFAVDSDGILTVLARDVKKGSEKILKIETAVQVDDKKVEEMISQSVEHAFEDLEQRRWVELDLKAKRILTATEKALSFVKEDLTSDEIKIIEIALDNLKKNLSAKDLNSTKQAVQELDHKTQDLANLVMQKMTLDQLN